MPIKNVIGEWEAHFSRIEEDESISLNDKDIILGAEKKLSQIFDNEWLSNNIRIGSHPFWVPLANEIPLYQLKLSDLGNKLDSIKNIQGFDKLVKRLRNAKEYVGAVAEVEVAAKLVNKGFSNIEFSPKVIVNKKPKAPDIKCVLNGYELFVEITSLHDPEDNRRAYQTFHQLGWPYDNEIIQYLNVHKILATPRAREFRTMIERAVVDVKKSKRYLHIVEPRVFDFLAIHPKFRNQCKTLAKRFKMEMGATGPGVQRDDVKQLKSAFRSKIHQLPPDKPGIIVVFANLLFFGQAKEFYANAVFELEDEIYEYSNLVAGIVSTNAFVLGDEDLYEDHPHYLLARKSEPNNDQNTTLIIKNRYSEFLNSPILPKLLEAFIT